VSEHAPFLTFIVALSEFVWKGEKSVNIMGTMMCNRGDGIKKGNRGLPGSSWGGRQHWPRYITLLRLFGLRPRSMRSDNEQYLDPGIVIRTPVQIQEAVELRPRILPYIPIKPITPPL
jgi:hypothetical protein